MEFHRRFSKATWAFLAVLAINAVAPADATLIEHLFKGISDFGRGLGLGGPAAYSSGGGGGGGAGSFSLSINAHGNGGGSGQGYQSNVAHQTISQPVYVDQPQKPVYVEQPYKTVFFDEPVQPIVHQVPIHGGPGGYVDSVADHGVHNFVEPVHGHGETHVKVRQNTEVDVHNKEVIHGGRLRRHIFIVSNKKY